MPSWEDYYSEDEEDPYNLTRSARDPLMEEYGGLDFSSPEAKAYLEASLQPPPSEEMFNKYISTKPSYYSEEFKPSFGRRLASSLLAGAWGAIRRPEVGVQTALQMQRVPYEKALSEWETEGLDIRTRAGLADRARGRELTALKGVASSKERHDREVAAEIRRVEADKRAEERIRIAQERERMAEEREKRAEDREIRMGKQYEQTEARLAEAERIRKEEATRKLEGSRYESAKVEAHKFIKGKFPESFNDPDNPDDFSLNRKITEEEKKRITDLIRQQEDLYLRIYGLKEEE